MPWLVGGDFNEIYWDSEKLCGNRRAPSQMQAFREVLELCELQDLHSTGELFTWVNRMDSNNIIFERLDRFVRNLKWRLKYPAARVSSLDFYHLEHRPISLKLNGEQVQNRIRNGTRAQAFWFEKGWLLELECKEVIERGWGQEINPSQFSSTLHLAKVHCLAGMLPGVVEFLHCLNQNEISCIRSGIVHSGLTMST